MGHIKAVAEDLLDALVVGISLMDKVHISHIEVSMLYSSLILRLGLSLILISLAKISIDFDRGLRLVAGGWGWCLLFVLLVISSVYVFCEGTLGAALR